MERLRSWALRLIVVLNVLATIVAFGESFAGLYRWAFEHQVVGFWAGVWPLMLDVMILVGELALFVAHYDKWQWRHKAWLWLVMLAALGVSTAANTGHIHSTDWLAHLTAALPPIALAFTMSVGFGIMKRTFMNKPVPVAVPVPRPAERTHVGTVPVVSNPALTTEMRPVARTETRAPETREPYLETPPEPVDERPAPQLPPEGFDLSETLLTAGFTVTEKSFTMPPDPRKGIDLKRKRVRDAFDVDPDVTANALAKALEISWATAAKYLAETKEARGLELTEQERRYITSPASS